MTVPTVERPTLPPQPTWHAAVLAFKRGLIERVLREMRGNRTHAARALGLQRTYLLRLMRELGITGPR
jgi:transcriptional regulator with GAF, ATPase, and Fis domain